MGDSIIGKLRMLDPRLRMDVVGKQELDFQFAFCHRFGKIKHGHAWHVNNMDTFQTFDYNKFGDVIEAKSWLEVMEILQ